MPVAAAPGAVRMQALAADLPNGLLAGFRAGRELAFPNGGATARVYAVGMGGSAIAADLARTVVDAESRIALSVLRGPELPRCLDERSRVVLVSYSGDTWEALRAYDAAGRAGAPRVAITSGGELAERAETDDVPVLRVPPGMPPRAAVGHMLGGVLGLLDAGFPESNEGRVDRAAERTRTLIGRYAASRGPARLLAERIGNRFPFFVAESGFAPLARRWATQVEENAKRIAAYDEAPELFHNALVGWDALPRAEAARYAVVQLHWSGDDPTVRTNLRRLERLLAGRGVRTAEVRLAPEDRLEALLDGLAFGDQLSLALAERRGIDPVPVAAIDRMRAASSPAPDPPGPTRRARPRRKRSRPISKGI
ncbi:MAG TPA: SIS domain-containing protein [Thermoplasmata archaeon]|nr:SIS domain-containing protein [Thermoplasmata archaeon]